MADNTAPPEPVKWKPNLDPTHGWQISAQQVEVANTCAKADPHGHCLACGEVTDQQFVFCGSCD